MSMMRLVTATFVTPSLVIYFNLFLRHSLLSEQLLVTGALCDVTQHRRKPLGALFRHEKFFDISGPFGYRSWR